MNTILALTLWFASLGQNPATAVAPLNSTGVATSCDNVSIACTYTDVAVAPGPHFYFIVAADASGNYSGPSNRVDVVIPDGVHNAVLTWDAGPQGVSYFIYRGAPATNLTPIVN